MKIVLQKNHSTPEREYLASEEIDVDEATYDWLMSVYLAERGEQAKVVEDLDKKIVQLRKKK